MSEEAELSYLRVLEVDPSVTRYQLFTLFDTFGRVDTLFTPTDRMRQFAFVSYKLAEDAKKAQSGIGINRTLVHGRAISAQISQYGPDKDPLCNTMSDRARQYRDKIFPLTEHERCTKPNKINRYTRSDYVAEEEAADGIERECCN